MERAFLKKKGAGEDANLENLGRILRPKMDIEGDAGGQTKKLCSRWGRVVFEATAMI
jgi:hypothetical protein